MSAAPLAELKLTVIVPTAVWVTDALFQVAPKKEPVVWSSAPLQLAEPPVGFSVAENQRAVLSEPYTNMVAKITSPCWMRFRPQPFSVGAGEPPPHRSV